MSGQILVPFNSHLQLEDLISVIEEAANLGMVPGSLGNNRIFERRRAGGKESHREILLGGAKGVGRRDGWSVALRFAKDGSKGDREYLYRQFVKRGGKL